MRESAREEGTHDNKLMTSTPYEVAPDLPPAGAEPQSETYEKTLDIYELAAIERGARVDVEAIPDATIEVFEQTLRIICDEGGDGEPREIDADRLARKLAEAPSDSELRKIFIFAEILGGYDAVNDLMRKDSPHYRLSEKFGESVLQRPLKDAERRYLEEYFEALKQAIENARDYYRKTTLSGLTVDEMNELYALVMEAKDKTKRVTEILGQDLMLQIEQAVARLSEFRQKILHVERTVDGIFLVDNEVMFIATTELTRLVNAIFKGVGNPYLAGNIDGVMLLAARNLLIEVVSFYSYYGKHQIYQLFLHDRATDRQRVTMRIRNEVRKILNACKEDNKLVLTRIMEQEEEKLDLSIEAIQREAEKQAVDAVVNILPLEEPPPRVEKKSWVRRLFGWLGFASSPSG